MVSAMPSLPALAAERKPPAPSPVARRRARARTHVARRPRDGARRQCEDVAGSALRNVARELDGGARQRCVGRGRGTALTRPAARAERPRVLRAPVRDRSPFRAHPHRPGCRERGDGDRSAGLAGGGAHRLRPRRLPADVPSGRGLIAHELAHVLQQGTAPAPAPRSACGRTRIRRARGTLGGGHGRTTSLYAHPYAHFSSG